MFDVMWTFETCISYNLSIFQSQRNQLIHPLDFIHTGDDQNHDVTTLNEDSDDDDATNAGLHSILKAYAPVDAKKPSKTPVATTMDSQLRGQPKAKPAPKPKAGKNKLTRAAEPGPAVKRQKIDIGSTGQNGKDPKVAKTSGLGILSLEVDDNGSGSDNLAAADKAIIDGFQEQIDNLKMINPPLPDAAYKSSLTDLLTKANQISADVKKKQRSAQRRAGKDQDPLFQGLETIASTISTLQHLIKCYSA